MIVPPFSLILAIMTAVVLGVAAATSFHRGKVYSVLFGVLLYYHCLGILWAFGGTDVTYETLNRGFTIVAIGSFIFVLSVYVFERLIPQKPPPVDNGSENEWRRFFWLASILGVVILTIRLRRGVGTAWNDLRLESTIFDNFANLATLVLAGMAWFAFRERRIVFGAILFGVCATGIILAGARTFSVAFIGAALAELIYSRNATRKWAWLFPLLLSSLLLHSGWRVVRGLGLAGTWHFMTGDYGMSFDDLVYQYGPSSLATGGEGHIYSYFFLMVQEGEFMPYFGHPITFVRIALLPVPSSLLPGIKPLDVTTHTWIYGVQSGWFPPEAGLESMEDALAAGAPGSIHFLLWGDAYYNLKMIGPIIYGLLFGIFCVTVERLLVRLNPVSKTILAGLVTLGYCAIARGAIVNAAGYIVYSLVLFGPTLMALGLFTLDGKPVFRMWIDKFQNPLRRKTPVREESSL